jgi:hypothetical protein
MTKSKEQRAETKSEHGEKPVFGGGRCSGCVKALAGEEIFCKVCEPEYGRIDDNVIYKSNSEVEEWLKNLKI